jgi:Uma2 family endonuclease
LAALAALPPGVRGEVIDGNLYTFPRPRGGHQRAAGRLFADVEGPFERTRGGPGGWVLLVEPGLALPGAAEIVPDVAGWRAERFPARGLDQPLDVVPDWVCEVLSPSTRRHDVLVKRPYYEKVGVRHHWMVDLEAHTVSVFELDAGRWLEVGVFGDDTAARLSPFDAVPLDVSSWW